MSQFRNLFRIKCPLLKRVMLFIHNYTWFMAETVDAATDKLQTLISHAQLSIQKSEQVDVVNFAKFLIKKQNVNAQRAICLLILTTKRKLFIQCQCSRQTI